MEYRLKVGEDEVLLDVAPGEGRLSGTVGGEHVALDYVEVAPGQIHIRMADGRGFNLYVAAGAEGKTIAIDGQTYAVADAEAMNRRTKKGAAARTADTVTPPIPAVVARVQVAVGDTVEQGQPVIVVSAMKMETVLKAPYNGTVTAINANPGDKVSPGQILVDIEKAEE